jgi:hypothetical protein
MYFSIDRIRVNCLRFFFVILKLIFVIVMSLVARPLPEHYQTLFPKLVWRNLPVLRRPTSSKLELRTYWCRDSSLWKSKDHFHWTFSSKLEQRTYRQCERRTYRDRNSPPFLDWYKNLLVLQQPSLEIWRQFLLNLFFQTGTKNLTVIAIASLPDWYEVLTGVAILSLEIQRYPPNLE